MLKRHSPESLVHCDAVQAFGKIPVSVQELGVDLMTISSHKVGGPKGIGALYIREGVDIDPMIFGGHQENDKRAGTENVAGAVGFASAAVLREESLQAPKARAARRSRAKWGGGGFAAAGTTPVRPGCCSSGRARTGPRESPRSPGFPR